MILERLVRGGDILENVKAKAAENYMIKYCAQQGVESKLRFNDFLSPMISDFECAYVCGKFAYIFGIELNEVEEEFVNEHTSEKMVKKVIEFKDLYPVIMERVNALTEDEISEMTAHNQNMVKLIKGYKTRGFYHSYGGAVEDEVEKPQPDEVTEIIKLGVEVASKENE